MKQLEFVVVDVTGRPCWWLHCKRIVGSHYVFSAAYGT